MRRAELDRARADRQVIGRVVALVFAVAACRAAPSPAPVAERGNRSCRGCHVAQYTEWERSWHRRAFTDVDFQASYRADHRQYCVDCHAPRQRAEGVGCVDCHEVPRAHGRDTHARATTTDCRGCHDFVFPGSESPLQTTWAEHRASPFADVTCAACHAPQAGDHHDHVMVGAHDPALLTRAIRWSARRRGADVEITLTPVGVGHRFPTGDLFRRVQLAGVVEDASGAMIGYDERSFRRDWDEHALSLRQRRPERGADTRLGASGATLRIACKGTPARVRVLVSYDRGLAGTGDDLESFETIPLVDELRELAP